MTRRIFSLNLLLLCFCTSLLAQIPTEVKVDRSSTSSAFRSACSDQFAGTVGVDAANFAGQSNDTDLDEIFLCFGDELGFIHNRDQDLTGDPDLSTPGGVGYAFYSDRPTVSGPDRDAILTDPNLLRTLAGNFYVFTEGIDGDAIFQNQNQIDTDGDGNGDISIQDFFNNGDPLRLWFAPITYDRLDDSEALFESVPSGPCVNVNIDAAFSVVYLNPLEGLNRVPRNLAGSFVADGGLPEFDNLDNYNITITLDGNPTVMGSITSGTASSGSQVDFTVPQEGTYNITISDGKSCEITFQMEINMFDPLELGFGCVFADMSEVCIQMNLLEDIDNLRSLQFALDYDSTVVEFSRIQNVNSAFPASNITLNTDSNGVIFLQWVDFFATNGIDLTTGGNNPLLEICFDVVGSAGESTSIVFNDPPDPSLFIEITKDSDNTGVDIDDIGLDGSAGKIYIGSPPTTPLNITSPSATACDPSQPGGSITFTPDDGVTGDYQFQWENTTTGETGDGTISNRGVPFTINGLSAGDYSVTIVDQACGFETLMETIPDANIGVNITPTQPSCNGGTNGSVAAVVLNGGVVETNLADYTFMWQGNPSTSNTLTNITSGNYAVTVTQVSTGCAATASTTLSQPAPIIIDVAKVDESCNVGMDGSITLTPMQGMTNITSTSTFQWADIPDDTNSRTGLIAGNYAVTVVDANMCESNTSIIINVPTPPTVVGFDSTSVACISDTNGTLTVNVTPNSGTTITDYDWTGPNGFTGTGQMISNLAPGTYTVNITASDGCVISDAATLFAPSALVEEMVTPTNPTCPGDDDGSLSVQVSGGTAPYFYRWSTGDSGNNFSTLPRVIAGTYSVTVIDANLCDSIVITETLEDPPAINAQFADIRGVSCFEGIPCDGEARVLASGGTNTTGIYTFTWESGETNVGMESTASQLCQGNTFVIISDGICGDSFFVDIPTPDRLSIDLGDSEIIPVSCNGGSDGSVSVVANGGTPMYTYLWQDGTSSSTLDNLSQGTYLIEITDANNCILNFSFQVEEPDELEASIDSSNSMDVSCFGETDGVVAVQWEGGNGAGGETYTWSPDVTTAATATNLSAGNYMITVTDRKGCTDETLYTVNQPPSVTATIPQPEMPTCFGFQTQVSVFAAGGGVGGPYSFSVNNSPQQQIDATIPIFAGTDIPVSVFDAAGCRYDTTLTVTEPPEIVVDLGPDVEVPLGSNTVLDPFVGSFNPIDSFIWTPTDEFFLCPDSTSVDCSMPTITPLRTVTYVLTVVDNEGCLGTDEIVIDVDKRRNVYIPNVFSPDGNGINDEFFPQTGFGVERINSMHIFDRWGKLLFLAEDFSPDDFDSRWDGRFSNKRVNPGVYVYLIEVSFIDGITLLYRGDVAVIK